MGRSEKIFEKSEMETSQTSQLFSKVDNTVLS
jgi:hypothetical protein